MTEQHRAYVFDTETTGKHQPVIVETALLPMLIVEGYPLPATMQAEVHRWNPGKPIEAGAWATHFIEDADVANERPSTEFALPTHNHYLIGHKVDYDWDAAGKPKNVRRICTLTISKTIWPEMESHKQLAVLYTLNPGMAKQLSRDTHSAGADVLMCAEILRHAAIKVGGWDSWEAVWKFSEQARVPKVMPFGKHNGEPLGNLPQSYVHWALKNLADMDEYLRQALEEVARARDAGV